MARYRAGELAEADLPEDLLTLLLRRYESWDEEDLLRECIFFLVASASTTTHSAPHTLLELDQWLAAHPEDAARTSDLGFLQRAVSEALRLHPPVPALLPAGTGRRRPLREPAHRGGRGAGAGPQRRPPRLGRLRRRRRAVRPAPHADRARPPLGLSFGSGPHTRPGRLLALGGGATGKVDREDVAIGVLMRIMAELFRREVRLIPERQPVKRTDTGADRFASFPVTVGVRWAALPARRRHLR